ncbi:MAG: J domain-containing protein [Merismopedia sp. SIO2A8]|nr:J domain-containing protein [Symploca sp. SIO2B6]NET48054.1 J domain-containing protein [Merismopedia sp. SIO2A8]
MQEHYDRLGLEPGALLPEVKKAYRQKLKEFPAHSHPQEFKAIRASYEAIQKALKSPHSKDFFDLPPIEEKLDAVAIAQIKQRATEAIQVTLKDLIALTF